jgi:5-oxoprolinase (ATP-hydrolysing)
MDDGTPITLQLTINRI